MALKRHLHTVPHNDLRPNQHTLRCQDNQEPGQHVAEKTGSEVKSGRLIIVVLKGFFGLRPVCSFGPAAPQRFR